MPRLACQTCGRQLYTVSPLDSLSGEERRCPRCGAFLDVERREDPRRMIDRRNNPSDDPGPPEAEERRIAKRRVAGRRGSVASDAGRIPGRRPDPPQ
jgi:hypothetical protein